MILGTHTFAAAGDASRRQEQGVASLRALRNVDVMNVQFTAAPHDVDGLHTVRALDRDSTTVTGRRGPRKPLVSDIFNVLWAEGRQRGARYFGFTNADILVSQHAIDWVARAGRQAYIFAREDVDALTRQPKGLNVHGADVFVVATDWWTQHRHRFRGYILGEAAWDNVYAAVLMCHGDAVIENRRPLVRHEAHAQQWTTAGPFGDYQRLLAAYDATYFSMWCEYVAALLEMRALDSSEAQEHALARRTFTWPPPLPRRAIQQLRSVKAFVRYRAATLRHT